MTEAAPNKNLSCSSDGAMLPLEQLKCIIILIDADDCKAQECVNEATKFILEVQGRKPVQKGCPAEPRLELKYLCSSNTKSLPTASKILPSGCSETLSRKDFNLLGRLKHKHLKSIAMADRQAAYINLSHRPDHFIHNFNKVIPARFKIGLCHDKSFVLTINGGDTLQCLRTIFNIMKMVTDNDKL